MNKNEHVIKTVYEGSIAQEMEIEPGDVLLSINGEEVEDVFDYRYLIKDENVDVLIRKPSGEEWELEIEKDYDDDLGMEFDNALMSDYRSCSNKCIFCFIDQMPPGMRETLYFKDDDSRLSFLQGNYITLTNMDDKAVDRIIRMQLAPINISVQTTNPELRCRMLNNRFAGEKLKYLKKLYDGHVEMNGQIVCVKNVNDGEELRRTINDLMQYLPFMRSVSVVPAGITKFRKGLYPIELFDKEEAGAVIDLIESYQQACYEKYGLHFIHASDEWYITAGRELPEEERYDGYIQLENGVGMMRLFMTEFQETLKEVMEDPEYPQKKESFCRTLTLASGRLAYPVIRDSAQKLMEAFPHIRISTYAIRNDFFGETITVSGLVTGQDLVKQILEKRDAGEDLGDVLQIPSNMLRMGEQVFLDDMTLQEAEQKLKMKVVPEEEGGKAFVEAVLNPDYCMKRDNGNFVYIKAFDRDCAEGKDSGKK